MKGALVLFFLNRKYWRLQIAVMAAVSLAGLLFVGWGSYEGAPPIVDFVDSQGRIVFSSKDILDGQDIFQAKALMSYGSFFGDGGSRGPDYTADALRRITESMQNYYRASPNKERSGEGKLVNESRGNGFSSLPKPDDDAIQARVRRELHINGWKEEKNVIVLNDAQAQAYPELIAHYEGALGSEKGPKVFGGRSLKAEELRTLSAFFYWGAWSCAANRPGKNYSYTHNWPYAPESGNTPTAETVLWSLLSILGLFLGTGITLYLYGQTKDLPDIKPGMSFSMSTEDLESGRVRATQISSYSFLTLAMVVFLLQVLAGIVTAINFVLPDLGLLSGIPPAVARSWHTMLQILWFFLSWIGLTLFLLPCLSGKPPAGQRGLIRALFGLCLLLSVGITVGIFLGPSGVLGKVGGYWFGHQGWEFMELGRAWQYGLLVAFSLWTWIIWCATKNDVLTRPYSLPAWVFYSVAGMVGFFFFGLAVLPGSNFTIAEFWRWMVVHMWVEATFEVYTTVVVGCLLTLMGLVRAQVAERTVFFAVMLFLGTSLNGIAHNFYWVGKPTGVLALGSVFSTLQVLPLLLLTLDAWRQRRQAAEAQGMIAKGEQRFLLDEVWLSIIATNFWNVFGAGMFGSLINLPIVNYFEHSTYLTGNHAHAAMFGVKGNIGLAGAIFVARHLLPSREWSTRLIRMAFWSLNGGLALMMAIDLFPIGLYQVWTVLDKGFWYARSEEFLQGTIFQGFTWMRSIGGTLFLLGGVIPLTWFFLSRQSRLKPES